MSGMPQVPCPSCGRMNELTAKKCATCQYAFTPVGEEGDSSSLLGRILGKIGVGSR